MSYLSFRLFLEEDKPAPTDPKTDSNYLSGLKDELGVDPSTFKGQVIPVSNFQLGKFFYNHAELIVDDVIKDKNGEAISFKVRVLNHPGQTTRKVLVKKDDKYFKSTGTDSSVHIIPADIFTKYLSQGLDSIQQQPAGMI